MTPELAKALKFFDSNTDSVCKDDVVPTGFFTAKQITLAKGLASTTTPHIKFQWDQLVAAGLAERKILKVGRHRTAYYKGI